MHCHHSYCWPGHELHSAVVGEVVFLLNLLRHLVRVLKLVPVDLDDRNNTGTAMNSSYASQSRKYSRGCQFHSHCHACEFCSDSWLDVEVNDDVSFSRTSVGFVTVFWGE